MNCIEPYLAYINEILVFRQSTHAASYAYMEFSCDENGGYVATTLNAEAGQKQEHTVRNTNQFT